MLTLAHLAAAQATGASENTTVPAPAPAPATAATATTEYAPASLSLSRRSARQRHARHQRRAHAIIRSSSWASAASDTEIGGGLGAATTSAAEARAEEGMEASACAALSTEEMALMGEALVADTGALLDEGHKAGSIISVILSPIIMMMMMSSRSGTSQKARPGVGATVIDVIVIVLTVPVCLGLAKGLATPMVNILANVIGEDLVTSLTEKLTKTVKLHCGYIVTQNLMVIIVNYLQNELGAVIAFMIATFLSGTIPQALTDAVTTAVTNLLLPKLTNALSGPVQNYYYCIYCYYYGDFCQQCFYDNDLTWMDRDWWLSPQQEAYT